MVANGRAIGQLVKLGAKYGPLVYEAARNGKDPAKEAAQKAWTKATSKRSALAHARTVVDGSVLQVFDHGRPVFVVYSGDEPIAVHPPTATPVADLLTHADLTRRVRPKPRA